MINTCLLVTMSRAYPLDIAYFFNYHYVANLKGLQAPVFPMLEFEKTW
jgi:hypothetical protein